LDRLSFNETAELAHFGAKVLHPFSVRPAVQAGIPLKVLNTFNPACPGTLIEKEAHLVDGPVKSITSKKGVTIIRITTPLMLFAYGYLAKIADVFARHRLSVDLVTTSEVSISLSVDVSIDPQGELVRELSTLGEVHVEEHQAIVSLVGIELAKNSGVLAKVCTALAQERIDVRSLSLSNARINLSLVLNDQECDKAVSVLHRTLFGAA
jgi:aspartate kinase